MLVATALREVRKRHDSLAQLVIGGAFASLESYREAVGRLRAYGEVIGILEEREDKKNEGT